MKLDPDCVRSILLTIEEHMSYEDNSLNIGRYTCPDFGRLFYYDWPKVRYHIKKCEESGYISVAKYTDDAVWVKDMTAKGHSFLSDIRDENKWKGFMKIFPAMKTYSLEAIEYAMKGITTAGIESFLKKNGLN